MVRLPATQAEKGEILANLVQASRTLLILDGLEPLQFPTHSPGLSGRLKDEGLKVLVRQWAYQRECMCVITSRLPVQELKGTAGEPRVILKRIPPLTDDAGCELLRSFGIKGSEPELKAAVAEFEGHALALSLLGRQLADFTDGHILNAKGIEDLPERSDERSLNRVMRRYEVAFETRIAEQVEAGQKRRETASARQLEIARLLGLFDRPFALSALKAVLQGHSVASLVDASSNLTDDELLFAIRELRGASIILPESPSTADEIDAHPSIRMYFSTSLRKVEEASVHEAHRRLFVYYSSLLEDNLEDATAKSVEDLAPAFAAITHGCAAGVHREVFDNVFGRVVMPKNLRTAVRLGAHGLLLTALAGFVAKTPDGMPDWTRPLPVLDELEQIKVASNAGFALRALGRIEEAIHAFESAALLNQKYGSPTGVSMGQRHLALALLDSGRIQDAITEAEKADSEEVSKFQRSENLLVLGQVLHAAGRWDEAESKFAEAERISSSKKHPYLMGRRGFYYNQLLLDLDRTGEVEKRLECGTDPDSEADKQADLAFDQLAIAMAAHKTGYYTKASDGAARALNLFRQAGEGASMPLAFLQKIAALRELGDYSEAEKSLLECERLYGTSGLELHLIDLALEKVRLAVARASNDKRGLWSRDPRKRAVRKMSDTLKAAQDSIKALGYKRRENDIAELLRK